MNKYIQRFRYIYQSENNNYRTYFHIFVFHLCLFLILMFCAYLIFKTNPFYKIWYSGLDSKYSNDSWKFIENTLNLSKPPYPYHLLATSIHYFILFSVISMIIPSQIALVCSILTLNFIISLFTIYLFYFFFLDTFHTSNRQAILLMAFYDSVFISPYLLLATAEILFLFYQIGVWFCLNRQKYSIAAIISAMTFALRFNGAFFVLGVLLIFFLKWWESRRIELKLMIKGIIVVIIMFIIGFSSFILSWFAFGDFWLPYTSQSGVYQNPQGFAANGVFSIPFIWWITYFQWVFLSKSFFELIYLFLSIIAFGLAIISLYALIKWVRTENLKKEIKLIIIYACGFIGLNFIVSGSNFARFISFSFPVFSIFPLLSKKVCFSSFKLNTLIIGSGILGIIYNILWWLTYPI